MADAQEELEDVGTRRQSGKASSEIRRLRNSGPLQGFNDPGTRAYQPLVQPPVDQADASSASDNSEDIDEQQTAQTFRAGTVAAQRRQQAQQQMRQRRATQQSKVKDAPIVVSTAQEFVEQQYKRGWQIAQEVVEDLVIETFFLLNLVLIPMYLTRWIGGNMMGGLFTISRDVPGGGKVSLKLIPGYSLADPFDYVRHMKFLLLAVLPLAILGFILMLLYFWVNWANIFDPNIRGLWGALINTLPSFSK